LTARGARCIDQPGANARQYEEQTMLHHDFIDSWLHTIVEASANVVFALSGSLARVRKRLDMVGCAR